MINKLKLKLLKYLSGDLYLILFGIITITPFVLISFFNNPAADDFCWYIKCQSLGFWKAQMDWYTTWTGRYFSCVLLSLNPLEFKMFFTYKLTPVILIAALFCSLYYLVSMVFVNLRKKEIILVALFIQGIFFFQMPSISEGLYWLSGSITYQVANILSILLFCFVIKLVQTKKVKFLIMSVLAVFAIIGSNETSMLIVVFLLVSAFIFDSIKSKKINYLLLILLVFAGIFSTMVIKAPGNIAREAHFPNGHQFVFSFIKTIETAIIFLIKWLPLTILFTILLFDYINKYIQLTHNSIFNVHPVFAFSIVCAILFIGLFPGFWSMGHYPPTRAINIVYLFFLLSFFYAFFSLYFYLRKKEIPFLTISPYVRMFLCIIIIINLSQRNNIRTVYGDLLTGKAYKYDLQLKDRYKIIQNAIGDTSIVTKLKNQPATLFVDDITADTKDWRNQCYDAFWKAKPIIINEK